MSTNSTDLGNTDLSNKVCLVTGATSGIGESAAQSLAKMGAEVFLLARSESKAAATRDRIVQATGNENVTVLLGDLASQDDIRRVASEFLATGKPLNVLLNNAGITNLKREETADGYEAMFAVNHLGYFLLTNLLLDKLKETPDARIVCVASGAHEFVKDGLNINDLHYEQGFSSMKVYGHSKLANILFVRELARKLEGSGLTVNAMHPGAVATGLGTQNGWFGKAIMGILKPFFRSPAKGAETAVYLATSKDVAGKSGGYYYNCKPKEPKPWAKDDAMAAELWQRSLEMTGLQA